MWWWQFIYVYRKSVQNDWDYLGLKCHLGFALRYSSKRRNKDPKWIEQRTHGHELLIVEAMATWGFLTISSFVCLKFFHKKKKKGTVCTVVATIITTTCSSSIISWLGTQAWGRWHLILWGQVPAKRARQGPVVKTLAEKRGPAQLPGTGKSPVR